MSTFQERQKNLFDHLKDAENHNNFNQSQKNAASSRCEELDKRSYRRLKHEMKQFRGKESIFKRKEANIRECLRAKTIPDYIKNPKRWVYYSLSDVTPEQMSDSTNTATALAYIKEIENRELDNAMNIEENVDSDDVLFKKPTFRPSATLKKAEEVKDKQILFKGNKVIMPEYVVGVSKKEERKEKRIKSEPTKNSNKSNVKELKLSHLYEDE